MTKIKILRTHGYSNLKSVELPITVNAQKAHESCYEVYAEEFRPYGAIEERPEANEGRGLYHSFYSEGSFILVSEENK
tara:strand:+ start:2693 stop:2926 length:234 start_codon:yes stop_codon:yes gene_type:complete